MKLIIDIPDEYYKFFRDLQYYSPGRRSGRTIERNVINAIKNGTPYNPSNDLISREALKEALAKEIKTNDMGLWLKILLVIDNAPTVEQNWRFYYDHGYHQAKEDIARRIKEQYNEHHELIPYWLSVGDTKGGAE